MNNAYRLLLAITLLAIAARPAAAQLSTPVENPDARPFYVWLNTGVGIGLGDMAIGSGFWASGSYGSLMISLRATAFDNLALFDTNRHWWADAGVLAGYAAVGKSGYLGASAGLSSITVRHGPGPDHTQQAIGVPIEGRAFLFFGRTPEGGGIGVIVAANLNRIRPVVGLVLGFQIGFE